MFKSVVVSLFGLLLILLTSGCFRAEISEVAIHVPSMESERDSRIVTNAALDEVVGSLGSLKHEYEFDLNNHVMIYHESQRLRSAQYQAHLVASLKAVGFDARIDKVVFNPIPAIRLPDETILNEWPDRFSARIVVEGMDTVQEANIVVDALAYIRNGGDDPRVSSDLENGKLDIIYNNVVLSDKNIEEAIACTGYSANSMPPKDVSNGWSDYIFPPQPY